MLACSHTVLVLHGFAAQRQIRLAVRQHTKALVPIESDVGGHATSSATSWDLLLPVDLVRAWEHLFVHAVPAGSADSVELVGDICRGGGGVAAAAAAAAAASIAAAAGAEAAIGQRSNTLAHTQRSRHAHAHAHTLRYSACPSPVRHRHACVPVLLDVRGEARSVALACMSVRCHPCEMRCARLSQCRACT